jgi:hypothetical protein
MNEGNPFAGLEPPEKEYGRGRGMSPIVLAAIIGGSVVVLAAFIGVLVIALHEAAKQPMENGTATPVVRKEQPPRKEKQVAAQEQAKPAPSKREEPKQTKPAPTKPIEPKQAGPTPTKPVEPKPVASLNVVTLWEEFLHNGLAADTKYKDKYVEISGGVRVIQNDAKGRYFVGFEIVSPAALTQGQYNRLSPMEKKWFREGYPPNVVCYLSSEAQQSFASIKPGQRIKVVAKVIGSKRADVWRDVMVELEDARLSK